MKIIIKIVLILVVLVLSLFSIKSCIMTTWSSPEEITTYSIYGVDGRTLSIVFMPNHMTYIIYMNEVKNSLEIELSEMKGVFGTHYFGTLWGIDGPGIGKGIFGLRIYPKNTKPVMMEKKVLCKYKQGNEDDMLRKKGDRTYSIILFGNDSIKFEDMWLLKEETDLEFVNFLSDFVESEDTSSGDYFPK